MIDAPYDQQRVRQTLDQLRGELLAQRGDAPHWTGRLSASALSTATAISALSVACEQFDVGERRAVYLELIQRGCRWLNEQQNPDGGFGDTDLSHSNIATSYLVLAARTLAAKTNADQTTKVPSESMQALSGYLETAGGIAALRARYGTDKTFVVPILNNLAIAGLVPWSDVAALPFEAAVFPQAMYRFLGMPVVSYAVPALVAIGQAKFRRSGCWPPWSWVRQAAIAPSLKVLERMQPGSGGYLEATPLTAFVVMSLVDTQSDSRPSTRPASTCHRVIEQGLQFLVNSVDADGSWPIDTNLATWVTSLSVAALAMDANDSRDWSSDSLMEWLLSCQHTVRHPFTGADPGGWGWTDLSGAVPDADDTPAAMIALSQLRSSSSSDQRERMDTARQAGSDWLLKLQNRDGGWPTFCRGWGKLPFDRSSTDLTAHAIRAFRTMPSNPRIETAIRRGLKFLRKSQRADGSWLPLWFGNQDRIEEDNPIYGTAKVLVDVHRELGADSICRGIAYLVNSRNPDGGWGGGESVTQFWDSHESQKFSPNVSRSSTFEETSLAVEALASLWKRLCNHEFEHESSNSLDSISCLTELTRDAILSGTNWLINGVQAGHHRVAWPIGFYFAKLWYHERLYPLIFTTAALTRVASLAPATDFPTSADFPSR